MKMIRTAGISIVALAAAAIVSGCQTIDDQAPLELQEANEAVNAAFKADAEDYVPSAMEAARRKLDHAATQIEAAASLSQDGKEDQAAAAQNDAIKAANEAKAIAQGAMNLIADLNAYNANSGAYLTLNERAAKTESLQAQVAELQTERAQLEDQLANTRDEMQSLENRPAEQVIPSDFRVGKPVAYFATGSTVLPTKYRDDLKEIAAFVKKNPDLEVKLEGFADPRGSMERNKALAEGRVQAVAEQLRSLGVPEDRLQIVPVGATADASTAHSLSGGELQLDRKVTATIMTTAH